MSRMWLLFLSTACWTTESMYCWKVSTNCFWEKVLADLIALSQNLGKSYVRQQDKDTRRRGTHCWAIFPPTHSSSGRGVCELRMASMMMSAWIPAVLMLATSVCSSMTKNRFIKSHPILHPPGKRLLATSCQVGYISDFCRAKGRPRMLGDLKE